MALEENRSAPAGPASKRCVHSARWPFPRKRAAALVLSAKRRASPRRTSSAIVRKRDSAAVRRGEEESARLLLALAPEAVPIKLDGDVRDAEARRSSSRLAGPFSRSLSAVMECINIGEPAGLPTDAPCTLRARPFASNNRGRCRDTSRGMEYSYKPPLRCKPPDPAH